MLQERIVGGDAEQDPGQPRLGGVPQGDALGNRVLISEAGQPCAGDGSQGRLVQGHEIAAQGAANRAADTAVGIVSQYAQKAAGNLGRGRPGATDEVRTVLAQQGPALLQVGDSDEWLQRWLQLDHGAVTSDALPQRQVVAPEFGLVGRQGAGWQASAGAIGRAPPPQPGGDAGQGQSRHDVQHGQPSQEQDGRGTPGQGGDQRQPVGAQGETVHAGLALTEVGDHQPRGASYEYRFEQRPDCGNCSRH